MKKINLKELPINEIDKKLREVQEKLVKLHLWKNSEKIEKSHKLKENRRKIARLKTHLNLKRKGLL